MLLSAVSVLGVALLGVGVAAEIGVLVGITLGGLVLVALVNGITVLGRLLAALDD
jgi:hypothetical protein